MWQKHLQVLTKNCPQWEQNRRDHDLYINRQYKEVLEDAIMNTQGKNMKKSFATLKACTGYHNKSKILNVEDGPLIGKYKRELSDKLLD